MTLANARYWLNGAYPMLAVDVDGRPATLSAECKPTLFEAGWVYLGSAFADLNPEATFKVAASEGGGSVPLQGCSRDPHLHQLYAAFLRDADSDDFAEGPVEIPA